MVCNRGEPDGPYHAVAADSNGNRGTEVKDNREMLRENSLPEEAHQTADLDEEVG